MHKKGLGVSL